MFIHDVLIIILGSSAGLRRILYNIPLKSLDCFNMSISVGLTAGLTFVEDASNVQLFRRYFDARSLLQTRDEITYSSRRPARKYCKPGTGLIFNTALESRRESGMTARIFMHPLYISATMIQKAQREFY